MSIKKLFKKDERDFNSSHLHTSTPPSQHDSWALAALCVLFASTFPTLFLYFNNYGAISISNLLSTAWPYAVICLSMSILIFLLTRSAAKSALLVLIWFIPLANYSFIEKPIQKLIPSAQYWHIVAVLLIILVHCSMIILRHISQETSHTLIKAISVASVALLLFNTVLVLPSIKTSLDSGGDTTESEPEVEIVDTVDAYNQNLPNVYWMVFDEYCSFNNIKKYYSYNNDEFSSYLLDNGFSLSLTSHNNSASTNTVLTNYLNLEYAANDNMTTAQKNDLRMGESCPIFNLYKQYGYEIVGIGAMSYINMESAVTERGSKSEATIDGESLPQIISKRTIFYPLLESVDKNEFRQTVLLNYIDYITCRDNFPDHGCFTFMYLIFPHQPFYFDANGNLNDPIAYKDWLNKEYYLGNYIYATKIMRTVIDSILADDPNAVIVLQSDHSARTVMDNSGNIIISNYDRCEILNAVYIGGETKLDIEGVDGVNTLRMVSNEVLGVSLGSIEPDLYIYEGNNDED